MVIEHLEDNVEFFWRRFSNVRRGGRVLIVVPSVLLELLRKSRIGRCTLWILRFSQLLALYLEWTTSKPGNRDSCIEYGYFSLIASKVSSGNRHRKLCIRASDMSTQS